MESDSRGSRRPEMSVVLPLTLTLATIILQMPHGSMRRDVWDKQLAVLLRQDAHV